MTETNLAHMMQQERVRLVELKKDAEARKAAIDEEIAAIDQELTAIDAYESVKHKKSSKSRSGIRTQILELITGHAEGISRNDLLVSMNAKGDKARERSVTNALAALKKTGKIFGEDGNYTVASPDSVAEKMAIAAQS